MTATINFTVGIAKVGRAPKGGMVSSVNGRFYKGGWFMPLETSPLAVLEGTAKQVAWAEDIRSAALAAIDARMGRETHPRSIAEFKATRDCLASIADSEWWIGNRFAAFDTRNGRRLVGTKRGGEGDDRRSPLPAKHDELVTRYLSA